MKRNKKKKKQDAVIKDHGVSNSSFIRIYLQHLVQEGTLIFALATAIFLLVALLSYHRTDPSWSHSTGIAHVLNATGRVGAWLSDLFLYFFGYLAYIFPLLFCYGAWQTYWLRRRAEAKKAERQVILLVRIIGFVTLLSACCALVSLHILIPLSPLPYNSGGIIGTEISLGFVHSFNSLGANLILISVSLLGLTLFTGLSWLKFFEYLGMITIKSSQYAYQGISTINFKKCFKNLAQLKPKTKPKILPVQQEQKQALVHKRVISLEQEMPVQNTMTLSKPEICQPRKNHLDEEMTESLRKVKRTAHSNKLPKLDLLDSPPKDQVSFFDKQKLEENSKQVELRLADFGVAAQVVAVHPGPVVTRYELQLAAGTKVSKISSLAKDLARSLSVVSVRVVDVIPGKSVIGLELPNDHREVVTLKEVLASKQFQNSRSDLALALGKDIAGNPVVVDLAKMPHLLVAGTTGSGKSVGLNAMLLSFIYKSTPEQLRLILIDPKMLELALYDGIPHLLAPVVTDMKDAATALRWCVVEMERRYRLMASLGVRNITGFNAKVVEAKERGNPLLDPFQADPAKKAELTTLPKIVVLADEFADMMVVVGKKVETLIARLAQKARAAGIHLIFATQRPSVDVITGLIKANIPTRIAFQVSSKIDSRTILDQQGAEQLLGHGDMLYLAPGSGVPVRVHGAYVHDDEVHRVVNALKESGEPDYLDAVLDERAGTDSSGYTQAAFGTVDEDGEKDPLYDQAVDVVIQSQRVSISSIQRRFKIGYNRAARIVEAMEVAGVVSSMETNGNRTVLAPPSNHE